jgi:hypothetical protein
VPRTAGASTSQFNQVSLRWNCGVIGCVTLRLQLYQQLSLLAVYAICDTLGMLAVQALHLHPVASQGNNGWPHPDEALACSQDRSIFELFVNGSNWWHTLRNWHVLWKVYCPQLAPPPRSLAEAAEETRHGQPLCCHDLGRELVTALRFEFQTCPNNK